MPQQLNLDKGSEIGWQVAFQVSLRCVLIILFAAREKLADNSMSMCISDAFAPQIDQNIYPSVALLKSTHNIVIESLWGWLRQKTGFNLREIILQGKSDRLIDPDVPYHRYVISGFLC